MNNKITPILIFVVLSCQSFFIKNMKFDELTKNCINDIKSSTQYKNIKVDKFKILAWYRDKDDRPVYLDCALCWAKLSTETGPKWIVVHMARNPTKDEPQSQQKWRSYYVFDAKNSWFIFYDSPPKNIDIYKSFKFFKFTPDNDWIRYDSYIDKVAWKESIGELPIKTL
jgi:hypothetical protein